MIDDSEWSRLHLTAFARRFIVPAKVDRYLSLARSSRGKGKWRTELDHFQRNLRMELAIPIPARANTPHEVGQLLGDLAPQTPVFVFSNNRRFVQGGGPWIDVVGEVVATDIGAIVSILPGELAIYWGEEHGQRFVLRRNQGDRSAALPIRE